MANTVFISSCSRRQLARRRPGRIGRRAVARRGAIARRHPLAAASPVSLAFALVLAALAAVALVLLGGI